MSVPVAAVVPGPAGPGAQAGMEADRVARAAGLPVSAVTVLDEVASTNAALLDAPAGARPAAPRVLTAHRQTAGRGRQGRPWQAAPGVSLPLSVAVERAARGARPWQALPLAVGAAVALALERFGADVRLKWPNDLQVDGRKAGGLLVESRRLGGTERVVIGVGLNLLPDAALQAAVDQPVTALFSPDTLPDRSELAGAVAAAILHAVDEQARRGFASLREAWRARDALLGRTVRAIESPDRHWEGEAAGIDDDGRLLVRVDGTTRAVMAGDVSVRAR